MISVTGHRGCAGIEPENTLRGFKRALCLGVDSIEFDVRATRDVALVVIHDETVDRTTDGKGYVRDYTLSEIRKLDAGDGEKVPTLQEAIDLLKNEKAMMVIEIKEPETLDDIMSVIRRNMIEKKVILASFWHDAIKRAKEIAPQIKAGCIIKGRPIDTIAVVKACDADMLFMNYAYTDSKLVDECKRNNVSLNVWPVDEIHDIKRMIKLNVDAITSNRPDVVLDLAG